MKKVRAITVFAIAALCASGLAACSTSAENAGTDSAANPVVLKVAFNQPETHPQYIAMVNFGKKLKKETKGAYEIKMFPNELLGSQQDTIAGVQSGSIDMSIVAGSLLENVNPAFVAFNLPYVFDSQEQQVAVLSDPAITGDLYKSMEDKGLDVVAGFTGGTRNVYTKDKAVKTPKDLSGLKIRVIQSDTMVAMMKLMGGVGTPMGQGDVYTAIQSGVLDGGENNELIYNSLKHDEIAPNYSYTKHLMMPDFLIMNSKVLAKMTTDQKKIFTDGLIAASSEEATLWNKTVATAVKDAKAAGAKFNDVDTAAFKKAVEPLVKEKLAASPEAKKLYDAVQDHK